MIPFTNRATVPGHVLVRHLDGESVLLNLDTEKYFGLDAMGSRMFVLATTSILKAEQSLSYRRSQRPSCPSAVGRLRWQMAMTSYRPGRRPPSSCRWET